MTTGASTAISMIMTSAMPSASNVNRASQDGIQGYDSRNWNRSPSTLNAIHMTTLSTSTTSDQTSATVLASSPLDRGITPTTNAPTRGSSVRMERNGKSANIIRPPTF